MRNAIAMKQSKSNVIASGARNTAFARLYQRWNSNVEFGWQVNSKRYLFADVPR